MIRSLDAGKLAALGPALVAVSGGRDSVALLHLLVLAGARQLVVAHLDHSLRPESAADARFVRAFAASLGAECVIERQDVRAFGKHRRLSLEAAARAARYAFFARLAQERGLTRVVLGHHADDQVETFLFNLLRGAGPGGLGAMRPVAQREIAGAALEIHRPLLGIWREEIDAYISEHRLVFREDRSNCDPRHTRNRIRHEILPMLSAVMGREVRGAIWRAAEIFSAEDAFLAGMLVEEDTARELSVRAVRELPLALQRRVVRAWLQANGVRDISFADVESVRALLDGDPAKANLGGGLHARRRAGQLFLEHPRDTIRIPAVTRPAAQPRERDGRRDLCD